jgi:hypothetical protein
MASPRICVVQINVHAAFRDPFGNVLEYLQDTEHA